MASQNLPARRALPAYNLYGERGDSGVALADRLHCESIAERSQLHGWEIRPHRHEALFQCLVIARGTAQATLEGRVHELRGPALVTAPALSVHGFRFAPDIQGTVVTVSEPHVVALLQPHQASGAGLLDAVLRLQVCAWPARGPGHEPSREVLASAAALRAEADSSAPWRGAALDAALLRLCVAVARALPASTTTPASTSSTSAQALHAAKEVPAARALQHVQRLRTLVEAQYRAHPTQAALAAQLGITTTQLNRVCRQVLGHTAQAVMHARLLLQAQRELTYSRLSVKQIAFELGFTDAAYFTRFFRRLAGCSPAQWRLAQRHT
jgi:AraC family transcriptional activator of pobA